MNKFNERTSTLRRSEFVRALHFAFHFREPGGGDRTRRCTPAARLCRRWAAYFRRLAIFHDEFAGRDECREFGVIEFAKGAKQVPVNELAPDLFTRPETSADQHGCEPGSAQHAGMQRDNSSLAIARYDS